jgi:hypothetical protein
MCNSVENQGRLRQAQLRKWLADFEANTIHHHRVVIIFLSPITAIMEG